MLIQLKKLRHSLLNEGKLLRYFAYAIGEILLVVIGILIALQVNQWNLEKNQGALEQGYYRSIKTQLGYDKKALLGEINYSTKFLKQYKQADKIIITQDKTQVSTVGEISLNLLSYSDFRQKSTIYKTLVNTGDVRYIRNKSILEKLENLETIYAYIERLEETHATAVLETFPVISGLIQMSPLSVKDPDTLYDYPFHNNFILFIRIIDEKNEIYENAINEIVTLTKLIEQELSASTN